MSESTMDRRTLRTKKMIRKAFSELLQEKSFNEISITNITTKADINRGTFYLHYTDKYDLLEQLENEVISELSDYIKDTINNDIQNITSYDKPVHFMVKIFEYIKENAMFMKVILGPKGNPVFQNKFKNFILTYLFENVEFLKLIRGTMMIPEEYFISYVISAHLGVVQQWLENDAEKSPQEMSLILSKMFLLGPATVAGVKTNITT
jgi:AcrR family transcriptional regulator